MCIAGIWSKISFFSFTWIVWQQRGVCGLLHLIVWYVTRPTRTSNWNEGRQQHEKRCVQNGVHSSFPPFLKRIKRITIGFNGNFSMWAVLLSNAPKKERQQSSAKEQNARATRGLHVVAVKTVNHFRRAWRKISLQACNPFFSRVCVTISNSAIPFTWRNRHESSKENRNDYVTVVTGVSCFYTGSTYLTTLFTLLYLFRPVKFKQTAYDLFLNWVNRNPPLGDLWIARMFFLNEYERLWERNARFTLENYQQLPWVYFFCFSFVCMTLDSTHTFDLFSSFLLLSQNKKNSIVFF